MSSTAPQDTNETPGLIASHGQYIKGAATDVIGSALGSQEWKDSAAATKSEAVEAMKKASEGREPGKDGFGKVEEMVGKGVGCEGMVKEGAAGEEGKSS